MNDDLSEIAHTLAMHAAAMKPSYLSRELVPGDVIEQAKDEAKAQLEN